jgi:exodeoxyribonuclease VII large subunit
MGDLIQVLTLPNHGSSIREICSVSKVTETIKYILEEKLSIVWICGEISNFKTPASGHAYFTLKDEKAQIAAVMFKGQRRQLRFDLENGATIVGMGRISVYEPRGTYQIILEYVEPQGLGALQLAFEQLKRRLSDEGLFDVACKKPIPFLPRRIAIITSPTGAVIRDLLSIINRRFPTASVDIYPVRVQGESASNDIRRAFFLANRLESAEVIILARGGGSLEDMASFNSEIVARAIFASKIPVISAIGHETDFTIADFVADLRAPTPSAAAEMVVPMKSELDKHCSRLRERCLVAVLRQCGDHRKRLESIRRHLIHPRKSIQNNLFRVDDLAQRLTHAMLSRHHRQYERHRSARKDLAAASPARLIARYKATVALSDYKLSKSIKDIVSLQKHRHRTLVASLNALNPYSILKRGFSITRAIPQDSVVLDAGMVSSGQELEITLAKGCLHARVMERRADPKKE